MAFHLEVEPKHKLTIAAADAKPLPRDLRPSAGRGSLTAFHLSTTTLVHENGMLIGHWTPAPWPEAATILLVQIKEDWFMVGTVVNGKLTDLMDEWVFEFAKKDGEVTGV